MRRFAVLATALSTMAVMAGAAPAAAAPTATITLLFTTRAAGGAAVDVAYGIECPAGFTGAVTLAVAQRKNDLTAAGTAVDELTCTGSGTLYLQRVTAGLTGAPFRLGRATLAMQVIGCDDTRCFSTPLNEKIEITA